MKESGNGKQIANVVRRTWLKYEGRIGKAGLKQNEGRRWSNLRSSGRGKIQSPGVVNFILGKGANLAGGNFGDGDSSTDESAELDQKALASVENMKDGAHVTRGQAVLRQLSGQSDAIELCDHRAKG